MTPFKQDLEQAWRVWLAERPEAVRRVAARFPPWQPVRIKATNQKGHVHSFGEHQDGTVVLTVTVLHDENPGSKHELLLGGTGVRVFGLSPDELEPWE